MNILEDPKYTYIIINIKGFIVDRIASTKYFYISKDISSLRKFKALLLLIIYLWDTF